MRTHPPRRNHGGRSTRRTRCLALGLCLTAGLALSACGPAHSGKLTVEPVSPSTNNSESPSAKPSPSKSSKPTPSASATPSATAWTMPSVTISNERTDIWQQDDSLLSVPMETSFLINRAYLFNDKTCQGVLRYKSSRDIHENGKNTSDSSASSSLVQEPWWTPFPMIAALSRVTRSHTPAQSPSPTRATAKSPDTDSPDSSGSRGPLSISC